jgi:hypothetical protein
MLSGRITGVFGTNPVSAPGHEGLFLGNFSFLLPQVETMANAASNSSDVLFHRRKLINFIRPLCISSGREETDRYASQPNEKFLRRNIADSHKNKWKKDFTD